MKAQFLLYIGWARDPNCLYKQDTGTCSEVISGTFFEKIQVTTHLQQKQKSSISD